MLNTNTFETINSIEKKADKSNFLLTDIKFSTMDEKSNNIWLKNKKKNKSFPHISPKLTNNTKYIKKAILDNREELNTEENIINQRSSNHFEDISPFIRNLSLDNTKSKLTRIPINQLKYKSIIINKKSDTNSKFNLLSSGAIKKLKYNKNFNIRNVNLNKSVLNFDDIK